MDTAIWRASEDNVRAGLSGLVLIADNCDAYRARLLVARGAEHSLDLMYYLWHDDHTGRLLLKEVVAAADRGVRVRMLLDDINPVSSDAAYLSLDGHPNIELKLFNPSAMRNGSPLRWLELAARFFAMTRRMHTKAWISDRATAIVGGRNIGDAYFDAAETNFRDLDLLLVGPCAAETQVIFEAFWSCSATRPIRMLNPGAARTPTDRSNPHGVTGEELSPICPEGPRTLAEFVASRSVHWTRCARAISDPPEKVNGNRDAGWLLDALLPAIRKARQQLEITSPYFVPGKNGASILARLVRAGVDVTVLTNSLAATDVAAVHGAYARYRKRLLKAGIKLYELQPFAPQPSISVFGSKGASLHTKAFTVDGRTGFVGSFNFDPRSVSLNAEMGVLFEDEGLAAELQAEFARQKSPQASYRLSLEGGKLSWEGAGEGGMRITRSEPEASLYRRLVAALVGLLPIESQL